MIDGAELRRIRRLRGLTLETLSKRSGVGFTHISEIENNRRSNLMLSTATLLASALGVKVDALLAKGIAQDEPAKAKEKPAAKADVRAVSGSVRDALHAIDRTRGRLRKPTGRKTAVVR